MRLGLAIALSVGSCLVALTGPTMADSPREFLTNALQGDNSEVMLGKLAANRARSDQVREYGRTLADDHAKARDEVLLIGRRMGLRPTREPSSEARDEAEKLRDMRGRDFDREFINYMIDDHQKDIRDFREEAREQHGPVSDLAQRQLPTLEKHLQLAMDLSDHRGDRNDRFGRGGQRDESGRDWRDRSGDQR